MADNKKNSKPDDITRGNDMIVEQMRKRGIVPGKAPRTQMTVKKRDGGASKSK